MRLAVCALLLFLGAPQARAVGIDGRLSTSVYAYQGGASDTSSSASVRAYQAVRLDVSGLGVTGLSFHTYLQGTTDLANQADSDPRLRLYQACADWRHRQLLVQVGRQRIQSGVGAGSVDGARGRWSAVGVDIDAYAGLLVPLAKSVDLGTWDAGHLWGGRLRTGRLLGTQLSLSFAEHVRQTVAYAAAGAYSGVRAPAQTVERRLAGVDLERRFSGGHRLYGRLDYDLRDQRARRSEVSGRYAVSPRLSLQMDWLRRAPAVFAGSLFSVFPHQDYQEIAGRLLYQVNPGLQVGADLALLRYDGDDAQRAGLTVALGQWLRIGYYRRAGYAGAADGLAGSVHRSLSRRLVLSGELDLTAVDEEADEREGLLSGSLGLGFRPTRAALLGLEVQGLRNPTYASDLRVLLRGSWRFFQGER